MHCSQGELTISLANEVLKRERVRFVVSFRQVQIKSGLSSLLEPNQNPAMDPANPETPPSTPIATS